MLRPWMMLFAASQIGVWACAGAPPPTPATPAEVLEAYVQCLERGDTLGAAEHLLDDGRYGEDRAAIAARLRRAGPEALSEARHLLQAARKPEGLRFLKTRR